MEIDITSFVTGCDAYDYSGSAAERGEHAGRDTWNNAKEQGAASPLLTTDEQLDALRSYVKGFGAWSEDEIAAWSPVECNAIFIQLISGDMREADMDCIDLDDFDWEDYEQRDNLSHNLFRGEGGKYYYSLSN
jgi:hypothetical protein